MASASTDGAPGGRRGAGRLFRPGGMPPLFGDTAATLIVDDDPRTAEALERLLTREGYSCTLATSAEAARAKLAMRRYALALVDVLMPGESGLELAADMLGDNPDLAVVMVTAVDDPRIAELALQSGVYGYIVKPFHPNEVLITVANAGQRRCLEIARTAYEHRLEQLVSAGALEQADASGRVTDRGTEPASTAGLVGTGLLSAMPERRERRRGARPFADPGSAARVLHDLNNDLGTILNLAELAGGALGAPGPTGEMANDSSLRSDLEQIRRAAQRATLHARTLGALAAGAIAAPAEPD